MKCLINTEEKCPIDMGKFEGPQRIVVEAIDIVARVIHGKKGLTGSEDCDRCEFLDTADAFDIIKALQVKFALVPVKDTRKGG